LIEIGSLITRSTAALPARRQPGEETVVSNGPVQPQQQSTKPPLRVVPEVADPEQLLRYGRYTRQAGLWEQGEANLHQRRALSAYGAIELNSEREYLHKVMGVDEYA
jgi:hypothetical protein